jgi:potassium-transporting ATPase KdpC subunit
MRTLKISLKLFLVFTILTGVIYPVIITLASQLFFREKANGSLIYLDKRVIGSQLIGQEFTGPGFFTPRPSAVAYNPLPSGGSNLGLTSEKLRNAVEERKKAFIELNNPDDQVNIPSEMLFASASGLDPHISPAAALLQVNRIVQYRGLNEQQKQNLMNRIESLREKPQFLIFGDERINVLLLNLELIRISGEVKTR